ncbi:Zinc transporter ZIP1 [Orchesella cincta]|uniref:Zinc transporter ZIP1 n=1 Tax=Orchesella cincta TaxID=48709 RepID=A0A1D2MSJ7_ORCCI|nr:Zinc transporter ZIP1 [Orchesella cincta]
MGISVEKWLVMAVLTVLSIFLGLLPYILVRHTKSMLHTDSTRYKVILTILSCFGAGVLFSTSFLHLLPEVRESFNEIPEVWTTFDDHFPVAEMVVICGFCLIYIVEEIAHFIMVDGHHGHHHHMNTVARHNSIAHGLPIPNVKGAVTTSRSAASIAQNGPSICITMSDSSNDLTMRVDGKSSIDCTSETEECPDDDKSFTSSLRTFLALIALSFHAIVEGVAVGLQDSTDVWVMFGAVASHKFVISFCMGMELVASQTKIATYISSIAFFAILSPVGIIIGSLLSSNSTNNLPVTVIEVNTTYIPLKKTSSDTLLFFKVMHKYPSSRAALTFGIACGTLLYVVFFEILNRERDRKSYSMSSSRAIGFIQFVALVVGLVSMGCLLTLTHGHNSEDSHDHGDDHDPGHEH